MADIRINALTTLASTTVSDDVLPIDGTTNGTRKLSAYSPSFGGNATVGGTLTVTGVATASAGILIGTGTFADGKLYSGAVGGLTIAAKTGSSYDLYIAAPDGNAIGYVPTGTKTLTLASTTASTSTSSGALVVSGGVGVAKELYLGIKLNISTHTGDAGGIGFGTETNLYRYQAGGLALDHASGTAPALLFRETGTSTLRLETNSGVGYLSTLTSANLILRTNSTVALTLDTSQNAIFAGTVRTAAPSGGTAASWKLGSVATVSPTSPNRTIEVDIGGTIYYIHAKTTNN
jgi:hypothetical protein